MSTETTSVRRARRREDLDRLIREKHINRYGLFAVTTEGTKFPDGSESACGFVVADTGDVFSFWLGWNEAEHRVGLTDWAPVKPAPNWAEDDEYTAALRAAGIR
jgi:hypothetical protein